MAKTRKGLNSIITLLVIFMMTAVLAFATACGNTEDSTGSSSSSSSSSSSTVTDEHTILNGNFEYYAESESVTFPYKSSIKWTNTRGYIVSTADYAESSDASSGIISTNTEDFEKIVSTVNNKFGENTMTADANPFSPYYYGYTELDENIPEGSDGNRVLMIHNRLKDKPGVGTAQYFYTSGSTLSLQAGEYGKLTVWVNTYGLATEMDTDEFGAYVKLSNKVSSTAAPTAFVKNINTNGQWAKVELYLEASALTSSSYTLYLGLGLGSKLISTEHVEGFAFFDDVTFEKIEKEEYDAGVNGLTVVNSFGEDAGKLTLNEDDVIFEMPSTYTENVKDTADSYTSKAFAVSNNPVTGAYDVAIQDKTFNSEAIKDSTHLTEAEAMKDNIGYDALSNINVNDEKAFLGEDDEVLFEDTDKFIYFNYTTESTYTVTLNEKSLLADEYVLISFWAKVDVEIKTATGLTVNLRDKGAAGTPEDQYKETAVIASTASITADNNGWKQYTVLVKNVDDTVDGKGVEIKDSTPARSYDFELTFGPTEALVGSKDVFPKGYALIGDFEAISLSEEISGLFSASVSASLNAEILNATTTPEDSYFFTAREHELNAGVLSQPTSTLSAYDKDGAKPANSGIFNTQYLTTVNGVDVSTVEATDENEYVQALAIEGGAGYYTGKSTVAAGSTAMVQVKLTTLGNATAYVNVLNRGKDPSAQGTGYDVLALAKEEVKTETLLGTNPLTADYAASKAISAPTAGEWFTVTFYVTAGTEDLSIGVEIWNGERWQNNGQGLVIVDSVSVSTSSTVTYDQLKDTAELEGVTPSVDYTFGYKTYSYDINNKDEHVTTEDEDGNVENVYTITKDLGLALECTYEEEYVFFANFLATNYEDKTYVTVETEEDTEAEDDGTAPDEETETEEESELPTEVQWLAISSVIIAVALIVALLAVIVRYFYKKAKAKRAKTTAYYDPSAREKANEKIRANRAKRMALEEAPAEEAEEEAYEYDYDEAANINEAEEAVEEEVVEEAAEAEVIEEAAEEAVEAEEAPATEEAPAEEEKKQD